MTLPLSIVIPTRNRRELLLNTLRGLASQEGSAGKFEVIVVADGCTDGTQEAVTELARSGVDKVHVLRLLAQEWSGAAAARNNGLTNALGRVVLFLDDDMEAGPRLVASHLQRHEEGAEGALLVVVGRIQPQGGSGALHNQLDRWWDEHYRRMETSELNWTAVYTGNVSVPRELAVRVGCLDESLHHGEDIEFGYRLSKSGARFVYAPEAWANTGNPKSGSALLRDFERSGNGAVRIYHKSPEALRLLPLAAYGETNVRMRVARGLLLSLSKAVPLRAGINALFAAWADSPGGSRIDRQVFELARSFYYWRGVRGETHSKRLWRKLASPGVLILMYHSIEPQSVRKERRYSVTPRQLGMQMALLKFLGYRVQPLSRVARMLRCGIAPPPKTAVLTFDDGYRDNLKYALPVLRRYASPATVFLVTGHAGGTNEWDRGNSLPTKTLLTWEEASRLDHAQLEVEAHSLTHRDLSQIDGESLEDEITKSAEQIRQHLGREARFFAYPYGHYNSEVKESVRQAGYLAGLSAAPGLNTLKTDLYSLKRVEVRGDESLARFALKVWAGDDPLRFVGRKSRKHS